MSNVLLHDRSGGTDHPAVLGASANLFTNLVSLFTEPNFFEGLGVVDVAHGFLPVARFQTVAGVNFAPGVSEEIHRTSFARKHTLATLNVLNQAEVKEGTEPRLGAIFLKQAINQQANVMAQFFLVTNLIVFLVEVVAVVESCGGELEVHGQSHFVKRNQIVAIPVTEGLAKADVLHAHFVEQLEGFHAAFKAVFAAAQKVVGLFQAFDRNAHADVGVLFGKLYHTVGPESAGTNHNTRCLSVKDLNNIFQITTEERFTTSHISKLKLGKNFQILGFHFFGRLGDVLPNVAHFAAHLAAVGGNHRHVCRHLNLGGFARAIAIRASHNNSSLNLFVN